MNETTRTCPICKEEYELIDCPSCMDDQDDLPRVERQPYHNCAMCHGSGVWGICQQGHDDVDLAAWQRGRVAWWWYCTKGNVWWFWWHLVHPVDRCSCGKKFERVLWWSFESCDNCGIPF